MDVNWEDGFELSVRIDGDAAVVAGNAAGLRSLAGICLSLAEQAPGAHIHLDEYDSLEDGSTELIIEKL